jgi:hypothetical protein
MDITLQFNPVTLKSLKDRAPSWVWSAVRGEGIGWNYEGEKGTRTVRVVRYAEMCGPCEDDYKTTWRVVGDGLNEALISWLLDEQVNMGCR